MRDLSDDTRGVHSKMRTTSKNCDAKTRRRTPLSLSYPVPTSRPFASIHFLSTHTNTPSLRPPSFLLPATPPLSLHSSRLSPTPSSLPPLPSPYLSRFPTALLKFSSSPFPFPHRLPPTESHPLSFLPPPSYPPCLGEDEEPGSREEEEPRSQETIEQRSRGAEETRIRKTTAEEPKS